MKVDLTDKKYWDATYSERSNVSPVSLEGFRNHYVKQIYSKKAGLLTRTDSILEIGGGGSAWILYFAKRFPDKRFAVLDYSDEGCRSIREAVESRGILNVDVMQEDFFKPSAKTNQFGFVYSHGVVEHLRDLPAVLLAHSRFMSDDGRMLTVIPNMAGILGTLTKS